MHTLKSTLFARASLGAIAVAAAVAASPASAQIVTPNVFGGGATLPSATLRNLFDCYATPPGTDPAVAPLPSGCNSGRLNTTAAFAYASVGSGGGQRGWASQDPTKSATFNPAGQGASFTDVDFAASDAPLSTTQVGFYNNGGLFSSTGPINLANPSDNCVSPLSGTGSDAPFPGTSTTYPTCYDSPRAENGPPIQVPLLGTGVVVAFDPIYRRQRISGTNFDYRFNYTPRATNDAGGLNLSIAQLCGIFSGTITDWNQVTTGPSDSTGTPLVPGIDQFGNVDTVTSLPIRVVIRDDSSGTTNIFINGLRTLCGGPFANVTASQQLYPGAPAPNLAGSTTCELGVALTTPPLPANPPGFPSGFTVTQARGNEGVAFCLNTGDISNQNPTTTNGAIGYASTDFTVPYVDAVPFDGFRIVSADIQNPLRTNLNSESTFIQATPDSITRALEFTNTDPTNPVLNTLNVIATSSVDYDDRAYPISGASYLLLYTCYDSTVELRRFVNNTGDAVTPTSNPIGFLNWYYASRDQLRVSRNARSDVRRLLEQGGFAAPPRSARQFVIDNYVTSGTATSIRSATDASAAGVCTGDL